MPITKYTTTRYLDHGLTSDADNKHWLCDFTKTPDTVNDGTGSCRTFTGMVLQASLARPLHQLLAIISISRDLEKHMQTFTKTRHQSFPETLMSLVELRMGTEKCSVLRHSCMSISGSGRRNCFSQFSPPSRHL